MSSAAADKRRNGVRVLSLAFASLFAVLALAAAVMYVGWHQNPLHWEQEQLRLAAISDVEREAISESFRNQLMTQWSDPGSKVPLTQADLFGQRSTIEIPYAALNTWIESEGVTLLSHVGIKIPESAPTAMIDSPGKGLLRVSFELINEGVRQVIALSFRVRIEGDGTLTSKLIQATIGRLPLPVDTALRMIAQQSDGAALLDLMQGKPLPPVVIPIDPGRDGLRDGRLIDLDVREDALWITRETIRRQSANTPG